MTALAAPAPLADDEIRLEPLEGRFSPDFERLAADPDVVRFTRVPADAGADFAARWVDGYESGWNDGSRAGFAIVSADGEFLGMVALVDLDLAGRQGEIGYIVAAEARGRGVAVRALRLLAGWALGPLGLERVELRISVDNEASLRVAERLGFVREGVLRSAHLKGDVRATWRSTRCSAPRPGGSPVQTDRSGPARAPVASDRPALPTTESPRPGWGSTPFPLPGRLPGERHRFVPSA